VDQQRLELPRAIDAIAISASTDRHGRWTLRVGQRANGYATWTTDVYDCLTTDEMIDVVCSIDFSGRSDA
jgi:hypothetical protein